jgi:hypothetical protein
MHGIKDEQWDIKAMVSGIYIKNEIMYYQLNVTNNSPVDYDIDVLRFFIRDKKKGKRTAIQETDLRPLHISGNVNQVKANTTSSIVFALNKFTIPDAK